MGLRIYVAGPYTAETPEAVLDNVHMAIDAGLILIDRGHTPFLPHLTHWVEKRAIRTRGGGLPYEFWLDYDAIWLAQCDALLYLSPSPGADRELAVAEALGLRVFWGLDEVTVAPAP
jgi:hypothetical protein